jgi:hypothetical protein
LRPIFDTPPAREPAFNLTPCQWPRICDRSTAPDTRDNGARRDPDKPFDFVFFDFISLRARVRLTGAALAANNHAARFVDKPRELQRRHSANLATAGTGEFCEPDF